MKQSFLMMGLLFVVLGLTLVMGCPNPTDDNSRGDSGDYQSDNTFVFSGSPQAEALDAVHHNNGTLVAGGINLDTNTGAALLFFQEEGAVQWVRTYTNSSPYNWFDAALVDSDGNHLGAGVSYSSDTKSDVLVTKVDSEGNELWTKVFGGCGTDRAMDIVEIDDGYLVAGATWSSGQGDADIFIMKINGDGEKQFIKTIGSEGYDYFDGNIVLFEGGSFAVAGRTSYFWTQEDDVDAWVVKFDSSANLEWQKAYTANGWEQAEGLALASDGNMIIGSISNGVPGASENENDYRWGWWILKVKSSDGTVMWQTFVDPKGSSEWLKDLVVDDDGNIVVVGDTWAYNWDAYRQSVVMRKLNSSTGTIIWQKWYSQKYKENCPSSLSLLPKGGYLSTSASSDISSENIDGMLQCYTEKGYNSILVGEADNSINHPAYSEKSPSNILTNNPNTFAKIDRTLIQESDIPLNLSELD